MGIRASRGVNGTIAILSEPLILGPHHQTLHQGGEACAGEGVGWGGAGCEPGLTPGTSGPKEALRDFLACVACAPSSLHRWKPFSGVPIDCDLAGTRGGGDKRGFGM